MQIARGIVPFLMASAVLVVGACEKKASPGAAPGTRSQGQSGAPSHTAPSTEPGHSSGPPIALGETTAGGYTVVATRDAGTIVPGGDAPIDVTISGAPVKAVRFWIGAEDAAGSIKARAEIENPAEPDRWHTHAEVPEPLPTGSRLWVEIEGESGSPTTVSFDLKQ